MSEEEPYEPETGAIVRDTRRDRLAVVMVNQLGLVYLRAPQGGVEWEQKSEHLRPATSREELGVRLAAQNARSRGDIL